MKSTAFWKGRTFKKAGMEVYRFKNPEQMEEGLEISLFLEEIKITSIREKK